MSCNCKEYQTLFIKSLSSSKNFGFGILIILYLFMNIGENNKLNKI